MKSLRKPIAILLGGMMVAGLVACGNSGASNATAAPAETTAAVTTAGTVDDYKNLVPEGALTGSGQAGGTGYVADNVQRDVVKVSVSDLATNIQPWAGTAAGRHNTMYSFYQPLFEFDKVTGENVLVLAESIEQIDEKTYQVKIRDGVVDSNGNPFTADDAIFSIESCKAAGNVSGMNKIDAVEKIDDLTITIAMTSKSDYQFGSSVPMIMMVTQKSYEESGDEMASQPVGTGPYKMTAYESGSAMTLEKVENYWGAGLADRKTNDTWYYFAQNVDKIEYTKIAEASQASIALENGDVDAALGMSGNEASRLQGNADYNVFSTVDSKSFNIFFNCGDKSPMANKELRQAVCYAIDQAGVLTGTGGFGTRCVSFGSPVFADNQPEWVEQDYYGLDAAKAGELIQASGFDTTTVIRLMVCSKSKENLTIAQIIQGYLMAVGLQVTIEEYDSASFASSKYDETLYDIRIDDASYTCLADIWTQFLSAGKNDVSYAQIKDDTLEDLLKVLATADGRTPENLTAAHEYIKDNAYTYGLYSKQLFNVVKSDIVEIAFMPKLYCLPGAFCYQ